jgi:hypothetical protein
MFGLNSEIDFEPTEHQGLWDEEATCRILVFVSGGVSSFFRFSVAIEAAAAGRLDADTIRARLREELTGDLERRLPEAIGMVVAELDTGEMCWQPEAPPEFVWRKDALRRLGYMSLAPHGMHRLGGAPAPDSEELWRRTLR